MAKTSLYFLALIPPEDLREAVKRLKEEMRDRFGAGHALKSPAHITLQMPFKRAEEKEAQLISGLETFASHENPFPVELSDFDCFAPRVIYIGITDPEPILELHRRLKGYLQEKMDFSAGEVGSRFHPHMTIATRDLRKSAFHEAWAEFETRDFRDSFRANSLYLLKHNGRHWDIYRQLAFKTA
ncbi:2'-5' RNA ligase family protein [Flavilitoribacter nigricans]|uniref:2'-5' RNA ligase n=1 Tax=Flavilitoribacter nigricans (strain ATCC 23147 / DSM 23189 / NBRC 102662 / NCIMB 1420 / SS-2) TaxID=1122177 RepID=A0A2D0N7W6_FLAN2|nr:2'-5' RNA ligase family protein [Flavilitoribacter nigricans]PHN04567.1 2'-5' RNA ligase [Flavilitoribacter nigricans DSM 23189 = NBRC 102662]